jgi:CRP/FNR family cyclic AMP-dependent transcriptional regulator
MLLKNFFKSLPAFNHFSEEHLAAFAMAMRVDEYPDGHAFTYQGRQGKDLFMLVEGEITVVRYDELSGVSQQLKTLQAGELFGLLSLVDNMPAAATCTAAGPVKVAALPQAAYNLLFQSAAPIAYHFQQLVAEQLARNLYERNSALRALLNSA